MIYWSYILSAVGLLGFFLAGKRIWWAWYVNIANQVLWILYAVLTDQWGFLVGAIVYTLVFVLNARRWTLERFKPAPRVEGFRVAMGKPMKKLRGPYECYGCGVDEITWCKDDCTYLDPFDWR